MIRDVPGKAEQLEAMAKAAREFIEAYNHWMAVDAEGIEEENRRIRVADEKMDVLCALVGVPRLSFGDSITPEVEKMIFEEIQKQATKKKIPMPTKQEKAGLELILRSYCYTNYGVIGEAKKWLWKVLENS